MLLEILRPILFLGSLSLALGLALGLASKIFYVKKDERAIAVRGLLPGINCGACGVAGCDVFAEDVVKGSAKITGCPVGGDSLVDEIAEVMGIESEKTKRLVAFVRCGGKLAAAGNSYEYIGLKDCDAASILADGGPKGCSYGCLGFGNCAAACPFDAIDIQDGLAVVNSEKCVACNLCISACPKNLIEIIPDDSKVRVACNSRDVGRVVRGLCSVGCISCKICQKACRHDAIIFADNLAKVDYEKCTLCGTCAEKCPTKTIVDHRGLGCLQPK